MTKTVKHGHIHNSKQRHLCRDCGRQFVINPTKKVVSEETKGRIDKLLLEKIPLAGIARAMDVSETWLQGYVNKKYAAVEQHVEVEEKRGRWSSNAMSCGLLLETKAINNGSGSPKTGQVVKSSAALSAIVTTREQLDYGRACLSATSGLKPMSTSGGLMMPFSMPTVCTTSAKIAARLTISSVSTVPSANVVPA